MIPNYYDRKDAENARGAYGVESGRTITKDGKPFVYIGRSAYGFTATPVEADYLTYLIVELLDKHFAPSPDGQVADAADKQA